MDVHDRKVGDFLVGGGGGVTEEGGFHTPVRGTMFFRDGAVTPGPSRERNITLREDQNLHDKRVTVEWRHDSTAAALGWHANVVPPG